MVQRSPLVGLEEIEIEQIVDRGTASERAALFWGDWALTQLWNLFTGGYGGLQRWSA